MTRKEKNKTQGYYNELRSEIDRFEERSGISIHEHDMCPLVKGIADLRKSILDECHDMVAGEPNDY